MEDLAGKKLVSTRGTTAYMLRPRKPPANASWALRCWRRPTTLRAVEMAEKGEADAFAMDDVLLYGLAASRPNPKAPSEGRFLTTECPGHRAAEAWDAAFKKVVDEEQPCWITSREILDTYDKWFMQPIPAGGRR